jgi:phage terminase Nu1 subunit (DNA packaging protein)
MSHRATAQIPNRKFRIVRSLIRGKNKGEMASGNNHSILNEVITLADLSTLTVLSERQIQRLVTQGILKRAKNKRGQLLRARFVLSEVIPAFIEHLRDSLLDDPSDRELKTAKTRRAVAMAATAELDLEARRGVYLRKSDVEFHLSTLLRNARDRIRAVPSRTMYQIAHKEPRECNQILSTELDLALSEISDRRCFDWDRMRRDTADYLESQGFTRDEAEATADESVRRAQARANSKEPAD